MLAISLFCRMLRALLRPVATGLVRGARHRTAARASGLSSAIERLPAATLVTTPARHESNGAPAAEARLVEILRDRFPGATDIAVVDISGGCGSMYEVYVEAPDFKGVRTVKAHKMVTDALKKEIAAMHGLRISTQASPCKGGA